jgi:hypothetical protein
LEPIKFEWNLKLFELNKTPRDPLVSWSLPLPRRCHPGPTRQPSSPAPLARAPPAPAMAGSGRAAPLATPGPTLPLRAAPSLPPSFLCCRAAIKGRSPPPSNFFPRPLFSRQELAQGPPLHPRPFFCTVVAGVSVLSPVFGLSRAAVQHRR